MKDQRVRTPYGSGLVAAIIDHYYLKVQLDQPAVIIDRPSAIAIIPPPSIQQPPPAPSAQRDGLFS